MARPVPHVDAGGWRRAHASAEPSPGYDLLHAHVLVLGESARTAGRHVLLSVAARSGGRQTRLEVRAFGSPVRRHPFSRTRYRDARTCLLGVLACRRRRTIAPSAADIQGSIQMPSCVRTQCELAGRTRRAAPETASANFDSVRGRIARFLPSEREPAPDPCRLKSLSGPGPTPHRRCGRRPVAAARWRSVPSASTFMMRRSASRGSLILRTEGSRCLPSQKSLRGSMSKSDEGRRGDGVCRRPCSACRLAHGS